MAIVSWQSSPLFLGSPKWRMFLSYQWSNVAWKDGGDLARGGGRVFVVGPTFHGGEVVGVGFGPVFVAVREDAAGG